MANQVGGIGQAIYTAYNCNFVLPLNAQDKNSKNRVGALLADVGKSSTIGSAAVLDVSAAHECVNPQLPLWEQLQAADFSYRADTDAELAATLSISSFNLSGLQWKYINEIIVSITKATVSQAPDDYIGEAVAFWQSDAFYKKRKYTDVVVSNCAGIVDLKYYFDASLDLGKIDFTIGKLKVALGATLSFQQGTEADTSTTPPTPRHYVEFSSTSPVVFGLVLANPADYE